jgi:predicted  nucleic acid-binding Zn-ribbon protein
VPTDPGDDGPNLPVLESVRCLECGAAYAKPAAGGTVLENPGCPDCGYVGWVAAGLMAFDESSMPHHSVADRQRHRNG